MRWTILVSFLVFGVLFLNTVSSDTVPTKINVQNTPPYLIKNFLDIFILLNDSLIDYLDLDDYFVDDNGDPINFSHSTVNNITITIDSNNSVSFIPDKNYVGIQTMVFYAADNEGNSSSNQFNIEVGIDSEAPKWSDPIRNRQTIYQNYHVNFSTTWTDNVGLDHFIFSINEGSGWVNSTAVSFSGTSNISTQRVQISASANKVVYWRFYASDRSGNTNVTDIQNFTVSDITSKGSGSSKGTVTGRVTGISQPRKESVPVRAPFSVEPTNIRVSLRQGDVLTKVVKIKNNENKELLFNSFLEGVNNLTQLNTDSFILGEGKSYDLLVEFRIPRNTMPDQYFGQLVLKSSKTVIVPIVIDVRKFEAEINIDVNISDEFKFIRTGEIVQAQISIQNLKDVRETKTDLFYAIKDFQGNILESSNEEITLYSSFNEIRQLRVPSGDFQGEYIFYARVISEDLIDLDSDNFFIGSRLKLLYWVNKLLYPLIVLTLLLIIFLLIWMRERNKRKKRLLELYLLLNELRSLVRKGKMESAINLYKRIKVTYGQRIQEGFIQDKEKLKEKLLKFSKILEKVKKEIPPEKKENEGNDSKEEKIQEDNNKNNEQSSEEPKEELTETGNTKTEKNKIKENQDNSKENPSKKEASLEKKEGQDET